MTLELAAPHARTEEAGVEIHLAGADERPRILRWLDEGLREGRHGRLAREYGMVLDDVRLADLVVARVGGRVVSHALARTLEVRTPGVRARIGCIGLVYTEPGFRGRGLAGRCIEACVERLAAGGAALAALWSDRHDWYARLGFELAGRERLYTLDGDLCRGALAGPGDLAVGPPVEEEWETLESLHARKPARAIRPPGFLRSLASGPDCELAVARRAGAPVAYAALGRGDDFPGIVHEWAGEARGVLACLTGFLETREQVGWLVGPGSEPPEPALAATGAPVREGGFALVRGLHLDRLWSQLVRGSRALARTQLAAEGGGFVLTGARGSLPLDTSQALRLLLDPTPAPELLQVFDRSQRRALGTRLPWPLFVWGFDSV